MRTERRLAVGPPTADPTTLPDTISKNGNMVLYIAIWAAIILAGVSLLGVALFGLRNLTYGKSEPLTIASISAPAVILLVLGFTMETWVQAGIMTTIILFGLALLGLVYTGITNLIW
jgi:hypothetical protein